MLITVYYMPDNVLSTIGTQFTKMGCLPSRDQTCKHTASTEHESFDRKWVTGVLGEASTNSQKHGKNTFPLGICQALN